MRCEQPPLPCQTCPVCRTELSIRATQNCTNNPFDWSPLPTPVTPRWACPHCVIDAARTILVDRLSRPGTTPAERSSLDRDFRVAVARFARHSGATGSATFWHNRAKP